MCRWLFSLGLMGGLMLQAWPAVARPELSSGDQLLNTDVSGCLAAADQFIQSLGIESSQGTLDRTGYFGDSVFRILCYGAEDGRSLAVVFASHDRSSSAAMEFIHVTLAALRQGEEASVPISPSAQSRP